MSLPLFFLSNANDTLKLREDIATEKSFMGIFEIDEQKHMKALRIKKGEHIAISDGQNIALEVEYTGNTGYVLVASETIEKHSEKHKERRKAFVCELVPIKKIDMPYRPDVTLVQGVSKGERMDLLVRQSVEIGVKHIVPCMSTRCIVKLDDGKRASRGERWRNVALSAAKQSGQPVVPDVWDPIDFADAIEVAKKEADIVVVAWEEVAHKKAQSIASVLRGQASNSRIFLFIGPEGGFEKFEVEHITKIGGQIVSLGDTILRTETAGTIASALAIYEMGGLGNAGARNNG